MTTAEHLLSRKLGSNGPDVFPLGLGCMGMSGMYGPTDETESVATIQAALDDGITLIDTGDFYGTGHNEMLIARAIKGRREQVKLSVKFGAMRSPDGGWLGVDCRPSALKNALAYSLVRLGVEYIDIYRPARLDPAVPIEDTVGAIADMVQAGYVRSIGLSEVGPETIRRAQSVHPISDLQIEYSVVSRGPERKIFVTTNELGIGITAYGVLSRGLLSSSTLSSVGDWRARLPRFSGTNGVSNQRLVLALATVAHQKSISVTQLCIAWVLAKGAQIVPVVGSRTRKQLKEALGALQVQLTPQDLNQIEEAIPESAVAGTRYDEHQMRLLDSER